MVPAGLATRARPFDELWVDSGCKYVVHGGVARTVSTAGRRKAKESEFGMRPSFITCHFTNT